MELENYSLIGSALISCQRVEFLTLGIVSHFSKLHSGKHFKNLTPDVFLDNSEQARKFRKQTLGQIFSVLKKVESLAISDKLDEYLEDRNILVHELWRKFLKDKNPELANMELKKFCNSLIEKSKKIERFYRGFLWSIAFTISTNLKTEMPNGIKNFKKDNDYFIKCVEIGDFI